MDAAMKAGANQIGRVQFSLKDRQSVESQVLREAATNARSQAEALASALGLKVARVLSVLETEPAVRPYPEMMALRVDRSVATPIESGLIDVHATVTLTLEISGDTSRAAVMP
jgi:hypothetical protein